MITGSKKSPINGFENYQINELGVINLLDYYYPEYDCFGTLSCRVDRGGYLTVRLHRENKSHTLYLHRILAQCFIENSTGKGFVNHKDGNKLNNSLSNLEWATHSENVQHAYSNGLITKIKKRVVDSITGTVYVDAKEAALSNGLPYSTLKGYLNGRRPNKTSLKYVGY